MKSILNTLALIFLVTTAIAQEDNVVAVNLPNAEPYEFTSVIDIEASAVKSQGNTGTCWSFSASSFLESEIYRTSGEMIDISEMYNVRNTYKTKAWNYVMRQGKIQFSEGGLAHDALNAINKYGLVPEEIYSGLLNDATKHDHKNLVPDLKKVLDEYIKNDINSKNANWKVVIDSVLDANLGIAPEAFTYNGTSYTPQSFLQKTNINTTDYITITSFLHEPFYTSFILNIPDNFSNGSFYNIPMNELVKIVDDALKKGFTLALDCDVSEKTFSSKYGVAVIPKLEDENTKSLEYIVEEAEISSEFRQAEFENFNTTDDHLMHIIGMVKDQKGNEYYKVKNSWGTNSERIGNNGYVYLSKPFFMLKTISITVHKDALEKAIN